MPGLVRPLIVGEARPRTSDERPPLRSLSSATQSRVRSSQKASPAKSP